MSRLAGHLAVLVATLWVGAMWAVGYIVAPTLFGMLGDRLFMVTPDAHLLALDAALGRLQALDARGARVVDLRYFAGLTVPDVAAALGVSVATVERDWAAARAWLHRELGRGGEPSAG